ncbi:MAG: transketolase [Candidatus Omnitrophota bacterium]
MDFLKKKSIFVRRQTLMIHGAAPQTRIASSLSALEIFTVMYYGKILKFNPKDTNWAGRDRFIISKGHGAISLYPILADLGFFDKKELDTVCKEGSFLGAIPDPIIPGFETVNGSLGHGLGVACGIALALNRRKRKEKVFVLLGDGELNEGSIWEAVMFAAEHKLNNLIVIIDNNKVCMLDYCKNILNLKPLSGKFKAFGWNVKSVNGHNLKLLYNILAKTKQSKSSKPNVLIAHTIKGNSVPTLERDSLSHIRNLSVEEVRAIISTLK